MNRHNGQPRTMHGLSLGKNLAAAGHVSHPKSIALRSKGSYYKYKSVINNYGQVANVTTNMLEYIAFLSCLESRHNLRLREVICLESILL